MIFIQMILMEYYEFFLIIWLEFLGFGVGWRDGKVQEIRVLFVYVLNWGNKLSIFLIWVYGFFDNCIWINSWNYFYNIYIYGFVDTDCLNNYQV